MHLEASRISARKGKGAGLAFVAPCLPKLVAEPPSGSGWLHEIKHDGYRTLLIVDNEKARAFTRRGHDWTARYATIAATGARLPCRSATIDGEVIVQDERGVSDFQALRRTIEGDGQGLVLFAFDLLHLDGKDLRARPLIERRALLRELLSGADPRSAIQFSDHFEGDGKAIFAAAANAGLEGIVSKRATSLYRSGRSSAWQKAKCETESEFIVVGAEPNAGGPPYALLAREEGDLLVYVGSAFVTLPQQARDAFWTRSEALTVRKPVPAEGLDTRRRKVSWFRPDMRVRARHLRGGDMLRHARLTAIL